MPPVTTVDRRIPAPDVGDSVALEVPDRSRFAESEAVNLVAPVVDPGAVPAECHVGDSFSF